MGDQLPSGPGVRSAFGPDHPAIARPTSGLQVSGHRSGRLLLSKGKEGRLCWASPGRPCPGAGPGASGEPAEKQLPWTVAQEDEARGAGAGSARAAAAWEDEALCTHEARAVPSLAQEGLTSDGSSLGAAFPSTLLAPSLTSGREGPQRPAPFPWLIEETRPSEGRGGRWGGSQRPAGEGPGQEVALQRPFSSWPATRLMPRVHTSLSPASLRALRSLLLQSQEWP